MKTFTIRSPMPCSASVLYDYHTNPAGFFRLLPPWERVEIIRQEHPFGNGHRVTIRAPIFGPITKDWLAEVFDVIPGQQFRDRQLHGPFAHWLHTHRMHATGPNTSELEDHIEYRLPFGLLGQTFGGRLARDTLNQLFAYRHRVTASDLRRIAAFRDRPRWKIVITGGTGLVGRELSQFLRVAGHHVIRLSRREPSQPALDGVEDRAWNPLEPDPALFHSVDAVVHLAGENIAEGRWTAQRKEALRSSRVEPTRALATVLAKLPQPPHVFLSASGIGIYGDHGDQELTEDSPASDDFLGTLARAWEAATQPALDAGIRTIQARLGVVLSPRGGALAKQLLAFKMGQGAVLGDGEQFISWITLNDLVGVLHHLLMTNTVRGPVNVASPKPVTNRVFGRTLAQVLGRPFLLTLPAPALRLMFGELADALLLASQRVNVTKLVESGFAFDEPELEGALRLILGRQTQLYST